MRTENIGKTIRRRRAGGLKHDIGEQMELLGSVEHIPYMYINVCILYYIDTYKREIEWNMAKTRSNINPNTIRLRAKRTNVLCI